MHDYVWSLFGGLLLGLSAVGYLYLFGRIARISGLIAQCLNPKQAFQSPAFSFIAGLIIIPFIYTCFVQPNIVIQASPLMLIIAGLLVGFGTRLGSGCTSGHGICGPVYTVYCGNTLLYVGRFRNGVCDTSCVGRALT